MKKAKIAVLVSGGGTNLQALIDAQSAGKIASGTLALVISNNPKAFALQRAANAGIPTEIITVCRIPSCARFIVFSYKVWSKDANLVIE